ncbi:MAG: PDZ domain-containing protein [Planctomycetes bacterium]|nr:PDZ domain-containing protein [Planctomycetota bacterium]
MIINGDDADDLKERFNDACADLDDGEFKVREKATKRIKEMGNPAIALIEDKLKDEDLSDEARWRLEGALEYLRSQAADDAAEDDEEDLRAELKVRVVAGSESRSVEVTKNGTRVMVKREGEEFTFDKTAEGAFKVSVVKDGKTETADFKDEDSFKKDKPDWHKVYEGEGFTLRISPAVEPAEQPQHQGRPDATRDVAGELEELNELLAELERLNRGDPVDPVTPRQPGVAPVEGELPQDAVDRLSENARKRLDRVMEKLERRARDNNTQANEQTRNDENSDIARERYAASLKALERTLIDRIKPLRKAGGDETKLDDLQDRIRDDFAGLSDRIDDGDKKEQARALEGGRKLFDTYEEEIIGWEVKLGVDADTPEKPVKPVEPIKPVEKDVRLPADEQADVVGGARVSRVGELLKAQLNITHGLSVGEIVSDQGAVAAAGVKVHDVILEISGEKTTSREGLRKALQALKSGDAFTLKILREGKEQELKGAR